MGSVKTKIRQKCNNTRDKKSVWTTCFICSLCTNRMFFIAGRASYLSYYYFWNGLCNIVQYRIWHSYCILFLKLERFHVKPMGIYNTINMCMHHHSLYSNKQQQFVCKKSTKGARSNCKETLQKMIWTNEEYVQKYIAGNKWGEIKLTET